MAREPSRELKTETGIQARAGQAQTSLGSSRTRARAWPETGNQKLRSKQSKSKQESQNGNRKSEPGETRNRKQKTEKRAGQVHAEI